MTLKLIETDKPKEHLLKKRTKRFAWICEKCGEMLFNKPDPEICPKCGHFRAEGGTAG